MIERIKGLIKDEEGAAMPEYALLVALIAVIVILGASFLGTAVRNKFYAVGNNVTTGAP